MTPQEVITELNRIVPHTDGCSDVYRRDKAIASAKEAVQKQIPQKPATYRFPSMIKKAMCPRCLMVEDESANYCRACGQALDWGSEDENA